MRKSTGLSFAETSSKWPDPGDESLLRGSPREFDRAVESSFGLAWLELRLLGELSQENAGELKSQDEGGLFAAFDPIFASEFSSCERSLNIGKIQHLAIPGECAADLARLERAKQIGFPNLEDPCRRAVEGDLTADIHSLQGDYGTVLCVEESDVSAAKSEMLEFRFERCSFSRRAKVLSGLPELLCAAGGRGMIQSPFSSWRTINFGSKSVHSVMTKRPLQKRDEGKSNSQGRGFNDAGIRIRRIRHADPAKDKSAPWRVHGASDFDLGSQRSDRCVADALLYAVGLQVQIDTKEDDCGCDEDASRNEKKSLGKCGHAGKLRNFSGM